jgi:hypothetical protein
MELYSAKKRGATGPQLILEGDAKQITNAIQAERRNASMFGYLVDDVLLILNVFPKWQIQHVN